MQIWRGAALLMTKIQETWRLVVLLVLVNAFGFIGLHFLGDRWQGWASVGAGIVISTIILLPGSAGAMADDDHRHAFLFHSKPQSKAHTREQRDT